MTEEATDLYTALQAAIAACSNDSKLTPLELIECCFQAANQYWLLLKTMLQGYVFPSDDEEIFFFRNIKPLFTSTIEYYGLLAHAQLFKEGVTDETELQSFVTRELKRLDKFADANHIFIAYYRTGSTHHDVLWFVRANNDGGNFIHAKPYDMDSECTTRYDYLVSGLLALEKYRLYLQDVMNVRQ